MRKKSNGQRGLCSADLSPGLSNRRDKSSSPRQHLNPTPSLPQMPPSGSLYYPSCRRGTKASFLLASMDVPESTETNADKVETPTTGNLEPEDVAAILESNARDAKPWDSTNLSWVRYSPLPSCPGYAVY